MPLYEHIFIARQDISSSQVEGLVETFSGLIQKDGGKIVDTEYWGLKNLAYRIKKNRKGHYVMLNIDSPVTAINEMERNERLNEDVLRYLTLRVDELEEGPSVMTRGRKESTGREREGSYNNPNDSDRVGSKTNDKDLEIVSSNETESEESS